MNDVDEVVEARQEEVLERDAHEWAPMPEAPQPTPQPEATAPVPQPQPDPEPGEFLLLPSIAARFDLPADTAVSMDEFSALVTLSTRYRGKQKNIRPFILDAVKKAQKGKPK